jgi:Holliday junction resolvase
MASRGSSRERAVLLKYREDGWVAYGGKASKGPADIIACRAGEIELCQVKSDARNPYNNFSPAERLALIEEAERAGARAVLCWWPPRGRPNWIDSSAWPGGRSTRPLRAVA